MKVFVLKIHCHLVQMTFVLSVKERCPRVCLIQTSGGETKKELMASAALEAGHLEEPPQVLSPQWSGRGPFPLSVPPRLHPTQLYTFRCPRCDF